MPQHSPDQSQNRDNENQFDLRSIQMSSNFRPENSAGGSQNNGPDESAGRRNREDSATGAPGTGPVRKIKTPNLDKFGTDLTDKAREGKLDPVIGREKEVDDALAILLRRTKNNPVFIGEAGVGKTAIVEELASMMARNEIPGFEGARLVTIDMGAMVAGTKYRGEFEERLKGCLQEVLNAKEKGQKIALFIDELHTIIGAGQGGSGSMDAANMMKEYLARGDINIIGATTLDEYRKHIEKDSALQRRFQPVVVEAPTRAVTEDILKGLRSRYEAHHGVQISDAALKAAVNYSSDYIPARHLPDKAIDLMDEAGALLNFERAVGRSTDKVLDERHIARVISQITGHPIGSVLMNQSERALNLADTMKERIINQDHVIDILARGEIRRTANLIDKKRPLSYVFAGPTGVGKTFTAKTLAEATGRPLFQFDMSEYMEKHNASRLIGAPPGYVGYEEGGQLTEKIKRNPSAVILLDEIEKAHPDVWKLALQIMEEGRITDSFGNSIDCSNIVLIMTTNAGAQNASKSNFGFMSANRIEENKGENQDVGKVSDKLVSNGFPPELVGRLSYAFEFNSLDAQAIRGIIRGEVAAGVGARLKDLGMELEIDDAAADYILKAGTDVDFGARPLRRAIERLVSEPLSEEILSNKLTKGQTVKVSYDTDKKALVFNFVPTVALEAEPA